MREIIFRGKDVETQKWETGYYSELVEPMDEPAVLTYISDIEGNSYIVYPETVGQYTGLNDKNGKRIFEGDIIDFKCQGVSFVVEWSQKYYAYLVKSVISGGEDLLINYENCQIVGNIHDQPELLEVQG